MRKLIKPILTIVLVLSLLVGLFGCYGNMTLTKKLYKWNGSLGNDIKVNVVFWVMSLVGIYEVSLFVDIVVLNTIEYWTGSNPLAMLEGSESIRIVEQDGKTFEITTAKNKILIKETTNQANGEIIEVTYDEALATWYLTKGQETKKIATMDGNNLNLIYPDGNTMSIALAQK